MKFHQIFNDFRFNIGWFGAIFGSFLLLFFDFKSSIDLGQFSEEKNVNERTQIPRKNIILHSKNDGFEGAPGWANSATL